MSNKGSKRPSAPPRPKPPPTPPPAYEPLSVDKCVESEEC